MNEQNINVHVIQEKDRKNLTMRYRDPVTGKQVKRSTGTSKKTEARRRARDWERELNGGQARNQSATTWSLFRQRYENEILSGLAKGTMDKVSTVLNAVEKYCPKVRDGLLRDLSAQRIGHVVSELRKAGRSESTIAGHLAHLNAALQWAQEAEIVTHAPKLKRPKRAKKVKRTTPMKGRPITAEEFERMLAVIPRVLAGEDLTKKASRPRSKRKRKPPVKRKREVDPALVEQWRFFLRGLWFSGLRLSEALNLYWDRPDRICVDVTGRRPMLQIPGEFQKSGKDEIYPLAPEFCRLLDMIPENQRHGRVFKVTLPGAKPGVLRKDTASKFVVRLGKAAMVKVYTHPISGKVKHASAHDLRRSFGERWATRVMPKVLMTLMRHETMDTTLRYYVGQSTQMAADAAWDAFESQKTPSLGTSLGTIPAISSEADIAENNVSRCGETRF